MDHNVENGPRLLYCTLVVEDHDLVVGRLAAVCLASHSWSRAAQARIPILPTRLEEMVVAELGEYVTDGGPMLLLEELVEMKTDVAQH